jgi:hypothetical protein
LSADGTPLVRACTVSTPPFMSADFGKSTSEMMPLGATSSAVVGELSG